MITATTSKEAQRQHSCAGKLHGYGFVQFHTQDAAEKACQLHGSDLMGRELTVDVATAADGGKAPTGLPVEGCWFCLSNPNADVKPGSQHR